MKMWNNLKSQIIIFLRIQKVWMGLESGRLSVSYLLVLKLLLTFFFLSLHPVRSRGHILP